MAKLLTAFAGFGRPEKILSASISNRTPSIQTGPPSIDGTSDATRTPNTRRQHKFHGGNQSQCRLEERPGAAVAVVGSADAEEVEEVSNRNLSVRGIPEDECTEN